jgi:hypothetical protein
MMTERGGRPELLRHVLQMSIFKVGDFLKEIFESVKITYYHLCFIKRSGIALDSKSDIRSKLCYNAKWYNKKIVVTIWSVYGYKALLEVT